MPLEHTQRYGDVTVERYQDLGSDISSPSLSRLGEPECLNENRTPTSCRSRPSVGRDPSSTSISGFPSDLHRNEPQPKGSAHGKVVDSGLYVEEFQPYVTPHSPPELS